MTTDTTTGTPARMTASPADLKSWVHAAQAAGHFVPDHRPVNPSDGDVNFPHDTTDLLGAALADGRWWLIHRDGTATLHPLQDRCRSCATYESGSRPGGDYNDITCSAACTTAAHNDTAHNDTTDTTDTDQRGTAINATDSATRLAAILTRAKREILDDIAHGIVPAAVDTFDELYTYVDADAYGSLTGPEPTPDHVDPASPNERTAGIIYVRDMLDSWLQTGRADTLPCEVCDTDLVTSPHTRRAFSDQRPEGALVCSIACRDEHYRLLTENLG